MASNEYNNCNYGCCDTNISSSITNIIKRNPGLTTGLMIGGALTTASIVSPTMRKVTIPTCKFIAKQHFKVLAGIGLFSIATFISSQNDFKQDEIIDDTIIFLD